MPETRWILSLMWNPQMDPMLLPSGKHTKNYGKSPFLMGTSTISMAIFNSYVKLPEGKPWVPLGGNSCRGKGFLKNESRDMKQFGEEHVHARTGLCKAKDLIH